LSGSEAVHILIKNISGRLFTYGSTPLPAVGRHPYAVSFFYGIPIFFKAIDALSAEI
jgi:hypothetical protein